MGRVGWGLLLGLEKMETGRPQDPVGGDRERTKRQLNDREINKRLNVHKTKDSKQAVLAPAHACLNLRE